MLSNLRRKIRNFILETFGSEEIEDLLTNGFTDEDKQQLIDILKGIPPADGS